jgi:uncharacterized membrane-anchored protein YitT (DUF2179 family)
MQVVRILMSFLVFSMDNNHFKAHNMLMSMLNVFECSWVIQLMLNLLQNVMLRLCITSVQSFKPYQGSNKTNDK